MLFGSLFFFWGTVFVWAEVNKEVAWFRFWYALRHSELSGPP